MIDTVSHRKDKASVVQRRFDFFDLMIRYATDYFL